MHVRRGYLIAGMSINKRSYRNLTIGAENMAQQQTVNDCQRRVEKSNLGSNRERDSSWASRQKISDSNAYYTIYYTLSLRPCLSLITQDTCAEVYLIGV